MTVTVSSAPAGTITVQPGDRTPASIVIKTFNIENATTSEIQEGVNLYFSNARAIAALTAGQSITIDANGRINSSATSSSNYTDSNTYANVNLIGYATTTNVALKANIIDLTTANVAELTNLYYTNARVYSNVTTLGYITSASLSGYATNTQLSAYATNAQLTSYATTTNVALKANIVDLTTANVTEITNQYFTNARAIAAVTNTTLSNITVSGNIILNSYSVGYLEAPQNAQNTSYTLTITDSGKHIYSQNTATQVLTIPTNANVAFNVGTMVSIVLQGSGSMTISPFSGVTLYLAGNSTSASRTISTYGMATLMKVATNTWFINGSGVS
jgi:hypothetical protein